MEAVLASAAIIAVAGVVALFYENKALRRKLAEVDQCLGDMAQCNLRHGDRLTNLEDNIDTHDEAIAALDDDLDRVDDDITELFENDDVQKVVLSELADRAGLDIPTILAEKLSRTAEPSPEPPTGKADEPAPCPGQCCTPGVCSK